MESYISHGARIGRDVQIGMATRIHDSVEIGDGTVIGDFCSIGGPAWPDAAPTIIGPGSIIRSHSVIYPDVQTGPAFETGHHTVVRSGTRAGINLRIGNFTDIEGDCEIGDYSRFHGYVHVGKGSRIGSFVWIFSLTTLANDHLPPSHVRSPVTIEDGVVICIGSTILPGAILRQGAFINPGIKVRGEVPPGAVMDGDPGKMVGHVTLLVHMESRLQHPWMNHYADAYPAEAQDDLRKLLEDIRNQRPRRAAKVVGIG
uniref:Transferase hexapeptide repeat containing protein n=1 Tax=Solibacter usitatus (strain Ellin6076) TaxID=234267 RepID=Q025I7_SOLUE